MLKAAFHESMLPRKQPIALKRKIFHPCFYMVSEPILNFSFALFLMSTIIIVIAVGVDRSCLAFVVPFYICTILLVIVEILVIEFIE